MIRGVTVKRFFSQNSGLPPVVINPKGPSWREASSVILAAKRPGDVKGNGYGADYGVLMLRRSRESSFLSQRIVFPGGVVDNEDFDPKWKRVFEENTSTQFSELLSTVTCDQEDRPRPPMISARRPSRFLSADIALRIAAIRETFEESGILLVRSAADVPLPSLNINQSSRPSKMHMVPKSADLLEWRKRVKRMPSEFQNLCKDLNVVPNIWALKEWSNWLTPKWHRPTRVETTDSSLGQRFDTLFYLCCLDESPTAKADDTEVFSPRWASPREFLQRSRRGSGDVRLVDPQIYELSRLCQFNKLDVLSEFATKRQVSGTRRMHTVMMKCSDGRVHAYTGDDFQPENMDQEKGGLCSSHSAKSVEALRREAACLNRIEWTKLDNEGVHGQFRVLCNFVPKDHTSPCVAFEDEP